MNAKSVPSTLVEWWVHILDVLPRIPGGGRFGRKFWIFAVINHAVASMRPSERDDARDALPTILLQLQQASLVRLTRADLAGHNYSAVMHDRSEIKHPGGPTFHFLEITAGSSESRLDGLEIDRSGVTAAINRGSHMELERALAIGNDARTS